MARQSAGDPLVGSAQLTISFASEPDAPAVTSMPELPWLVSCLNFNFASAYQSQLRPLAKAAATCRFETAFLSYNETDVASLRDAGVAVAFAAQPVQQAAPCRP